MIRVERRREPRERTYQLVNVSPVNQEGLRTEQLLGRTLDLSPGGARVEVPHEVASGARVQVDLALNEALVSAEAEVRHAGAGDEGAWLLGLEFVELDDATTRKIAEFLHAREARRG